jgi:hypothetical protein
MELSTVGAFPNYPLPYHTDFENTPSICSGYQLYLRECHVYTPATQWFSLEAIPRSIHLLVELPTVVTNRLSYGAWGYLSTGASRHMRVQKKI